MGKNILIFSDGTGQSGGVTFDENRTNIYKLFRATRCGLDSLIDPSELAPALICPRKYASWAAANVLRTAAAIV
jgi:hypothetical protein